MQITTRKNGEPACAVKEDEKVITVVFGDKLKQILSQLHEISPFSNNAPDDSSLKYSPSSDNGPQSANPTLKETISIFKSHQSENITETVDHEEYKHRQQRKEIFVRPIGVSLGAKNKEISRAVIECELFDTAKTKSRQGQEGERLTQGRINTQVTSSAHA